MIVMMSLRPTTSKSVLHFNWKRFWVALATRFFLVFLFKEFRYSFSFIVRIDEMEICQFSPGHVNKYLWLSVCEIKSLFLDLCGRLSVFRLDGKVRKSLR